MPLLLVAMGAALPLLIAPGLSFHYDTVPKLIALMLITACAALRIRALPAEFAALWSRSSGRLLVVLSGTLVIWCAIAATASTRPGISFFGSAWRAFGFVALFTLAAAAVLVAANLSAHPENIRPLLRGAAVAAILASLYGIAQYFDFDPFQNAAGYHALDGSNVVVRPPGTLGHADYFGWWLAIEFFCALAVAREGNSVWRVIGAAAAALTAFCTVLTGTRAAMLGIAVGVIVWLFLARPRFRVRHFIPIGAVIIVFTAFLLTPLGARVRNRISWSLHEPTARPLLWRDSLRMAASRPLTGYGPETFSAAFGAYESEDLAHLLPDFHYESPHNLAFDALTSGGIPALLIALAFGSLAILAIARTHSPLKPTYAAALAACCVASFFSAAMLAPLLLTALVLAIVIASEPASPARAFKLPAPVAVSAAVPVAIALIIAAGAYAVSDFRLARFQAHPTAAGYAEMTARSAAILPEDIYASRILSEICPKVTAPIELFECWRVATLAAGNATRTADDTANAWYNLAIFTALRNDVAGTRTALLHASQVSPNWFKPHWILAELLARQGAAKEAGAEAARAVRLDASKNPEVNATAERLRTK
jgi:O-antigen ligase